MRRSGIEVHVLAAQQAGDVGIPTANVLVLCSGDTSESTVHSQIIPGSLVPARRLKKGERKACEFYEDSTTGKTGQRRIMRLDSPADVAAGEEVLIELLKAGRRGQVTERDGHGGCDERRFWQARICSLHVQI